ncbi:AsnC family transcriptional regulator, partial [Burkholderia multivorans]
MPKRLSPPAVASLDAIDRAIVAALADDARIATSELARQIGLSAPATADRVRR